MSIIIYHIDQFDGGPKAHKYGDHEFLLALKITQKLREQGHTHVVMSNEPANMVGKPGVESVDNGKTPDGYPYEWSKQHRGAGPRKT